MAFYFNPLVVETFARLRGITEFLETMNDGIPIVKNKEHQNLEKLAKTEGWKVEEYFLWRSHLEHRFDTWISTFAAYSATILLYSVVETQLNALADYMHDNSATKIRARHMQGKGIEQYSIYLKLVHEIDLNTDKSWSCLRNLQSLRNIIVHRGGRRGESKEQRGEVNRLICAYPSRLELRQFEMNDQIWLSMDLCSDFGRQIDGFFQRVFEKCGLPRQNM